MESTLARNTERQTRNGNCLRARSVNSGRGPPVVASALLLIAIGMTIIAANSSLVVIKVR